MFVTPHKFYLNLFTADAQKFLGRVSFNPDWSPALESTLFGEIRRGHLQTMPPDAVVEIQPLWHPRSGQPNVNAFRMSVCREQDVIASSDFEITYFAAAARQAATVFTEKKLLKQGELFHYSVTAFNQPARPAARPRCVAQVEDAQLITTDAALESYHRRSLLLGHAQGGDGPVFVHWNVLDEISALTRGASPSEAGGVLLGRLLCDRSIPDLFLEVTAQIPAPADSRIDSLGFTPEVWNAVRVQQRRRGLTDDWVGWWHSHAFYHKVCDHCAKEKQSCEAIEPALSDKDCHLHRIVFPRAHNVALLVTDAPCMGLSWSLFGWRSGVVANRAFGILNAPLSAAVVRPAANLEGVSHAA